MHNAKFRLVKRVLVAGVIGASIMLSTSGCLVTETSTSTYSVTG